MRKEINIGEKKITIHGNTKNVEKCIGLIDGLINGLKLTGNEYNDRLELQMNVLDNVRCSVLYSGNSVYGKKKVLDDFKKIVKNGTSYLTEELYEVFHLHFGTIAHYNRQGWIGHYPHINDIKELVSGASFPMWYSDLNEIHIGMKKILKII